jgi:cold shock CspA family protein
LVATPLPGHTTKKKEKEIFHQGTVRTYVTDRGFRFIKGDDAQGLFFQISKWETRGTTPETGMRVRYTIGDDPRGSGRPIDRTRCNDLAGEPRSFAKIRRGGLSGPPFFLAPNITYPHGCALFVCGFRP